MSIDDKLKGLIAYMQDKGSDSEFVSWQELYEDISIFISENSDNGYVTIFEDDGITVVDSEDYDDDFKTSLNFISVPNKDNDKMSDIFVREDEGENLTYIGTLPTVALERMSAEEIYESFKLDEKYCEDF